MDFNQIVAPLNLKNVELSQALGVSDGHIADLKVGRRKVSLKLAAKLEVLTRRTDIIGAIAAQKASAE